MRYGRLLVIALALAVLATGLWSVYRGWQMARHAQAVEPVRQGVSLWAPQRALQRETGGA